MSPSHPPPYLSWTTVSYKRGRPTQESTDRVANHAKDNLHFSPPTITSNLFASLTNEDSEVTPTPTGPTSVPKPSPIYVQNVTTIPPLLQLLDQTSHQQYVITALANNQVRVQPTTADSYRSITHILTAKGTEFHTFKPKEERNYRVVLKHMHYSINPDVIKAEIEKHGHKVANIWTIKQFRTKLPLSMFFVDLKPASNNKDIFDVEYLLKKLNSMV
jgi:hypothetical protein